MGQESQGIDSVYDFLYVDHVRIASLVAQLDESKHGNLEAIKVTDGSAETNATEGTLGLPLALGGRHSREKGSTENAERSYNPLWVHARQFLDIFDELGFIKRDLGSADVGTLVVVSGSLRVNDPRFMKPLWRTLFGAFSKQLPSLSDRSSQGEGSRQQRRAEARAAQKGQSPDPAAALGGAMGEVISTFAENMPHAVRGQLSLSGDRLWFMLAPERMTVSPEEIVLKHGTSIPGEWHVACLIDALPGAAEEDEPEPADLLSGLAKASTALREQMGRPATDFGVTPLLVFRKVPAHNYAPLPP